MVLEVIPYRFWKNKVTGRTASVAGAHPAGSPADRANWEIVTEGWTWRNDNGTTGLCRPPAKTREEAEEVMKRWNAAGFAAPGEY
jgi:hypothetical protein